MTCERKSRLMSGSPSCSCSAITCSRIERVMYRLSTVSYNRLFGYFLIVRGSLMDRSLTMGCAPSVVQGVCTYHITSAPRTQLGMRKLLRHLRARCAPAAHHGTGPDPNERRPNRVPFGLTRA